MIGSEKIWELVSYDEEIANRRAGELDISPLVTSLLMQRGIENLEDMCAFLYGEKEPFNDPFLMKGMQRAVHRIRRAIEDEEKITVYGDYDVDGITATSILCIYLKQQGAWVEPYIPKRENEGYGLNDAALQKIVESGTTLIITVDCGISCSGEVARAPEGVDIIITDHHTVPPEVPAAYAVIDPKQPGCDYPFKHLCGAGIAFKICQALELGAGRGCWEGLLEIVALGTVADIVPLVGENREIVRRGLKAMENTSNLGLKTLIKLSGCPTEKINSEHVGFILAPRLNAVGRLAHALEAVRLLTTEDVEQAELIAEELNRENDIRKDISNKIQQEAEAMLEERKPLGSCIVLASQDWHPGVIGIVASRLVDKYNLPTILLSLNNGIAKGSCRSIAALNLYEAIAAQSDLLTQFGGHRQAAGLTLPEANLEEFTRRFSEYVRDKLKPEDYIPRQQVNVVLNRSTHIGLKDLEELELLEPFGCENATPVFAFPQAKLQNIRTMGKNQEHLSFILYKGYDSYKVVMWNHAFLFSSLYDDMVADVAFVPRKNVWNDEVSVQLHGMSIRQGLVVRDERQNVAPKDELLQDLLNQKGHKYVCFDKLPECEDDLSRLLLATGTEAIAYSELGKAKLEGTIILYDLPRLPLSELFKQIKHSVKNIVLLYRNLDFQQAMLQLNLTHPRRDELAQAYRLIMNLLAEKGSLEPRQLLASYPRLLSRSMLKIMLELDFLKLENQQLKKSDNIRKRSLEEAPLYCSLTKERNELVATLNVNMRLTQIELLRGRRE